MKKFVFKATALAIGALVGGSAFAAITLSDSTADARTYGTELVANGASLTDANLAVTTKIGFGIAQTATRFVRFDLTNAKWANNIVAANLDAETAAAAALAPSVSVAQGGTTSDSYVIFQVQANDASYQQDAVWLLALNTIGVKVTDTGSPVDLTYAMYETAEKAVANVSTTKLAGYNETIAKFGKTLNMAITAGKATAGVEKNFKEFTTSTAGTFTKTVSLGVVNTTVNTRYTAAGVAITLADIVDAGSKLVVTGDFSAKGSVFLASANDGTCTSAVAGTFATGNTTTASITTNETAYNRDICYTVTGDTAVPEQTVTVAYDIVPDSTNSATTADIAATTLGTIAHDGTTLQAPFATIHPDYLSRVVLTSTYSVDAAVTATVIAEDGVSCPTVNGAYTLKAGKQLVINTKDICPALSAGSRLAIKLDVVAPSNTISGVYNVMNYNQTTGATDSLISYPLMRPGTN